MVYVNASLPLTAFILSIHTLHMLLILALFPSFLVVNICQEKGTWILQKGKMQPQILSLSFNYDCWYGYLDLSFVHSAYWDDYWSWELGLCLSHVSAKAVTCLSHFLWGSMSSTISGTGNLLSWVLLVSFYFLSVLGEEGEQVLVGCRSQAVGTQLWIWEALCDPFLLEE